MLFLKLSDTHRDALNTWLDERRVLLCHNADHARMFVHPASETQNFQFRTAEFCTG